MKNKIETSIRQHIESKHRLGDQAGGSGHMGNVSYELNNFDFKKLNDNNYEVIFQYTLITTTEFTYYPDNPPYEDKYEERLVLTIASNE